MSYIKNKKKSLNDNKAGFTLMETVVTTSLFIIVILMISSIYTLSQRTYRSGSDEDELWQNARVVLDRISREIRQANEFVTIIPLTSDDPFTPPPNNLQFQDGHDLNIIKYIRYFLDTNSAEIKRQVVIYYFDSDPAIYVRWNDLDSFGNPPLMAVQEDEIVGQYFSNLRFWGDELIHIDISLTKDDKQIDLMTLVKGRNL